MWLCDEFRVYNGAKRAEKNESGKIQSISKGMRHTETDIQIRFADIDILGHVNNVNLQHYFDLGKTAFYREVLEVDVFPGGGGAFPITAATETSYLAQTRHNGGG